LDKYEKKKLSEIDICDLFITPAIKDAGWGLVPHQQRHNMLLLIPKPHTTLSTLIFCLIRSQKANSYPCSCSDFMMI
jgi:hypothetical protein